MSDPGPASVLVIGMGNRLRGDDAVGPAVAKSLRDRGIPAMEYAGEGTRLMTLWEDTDRVVVVDAMRSGSAPGAVRRFDGVNERLDANLFVHFSHEIGVTQAVELARVLGRLPPRLTVYGIEGRSFELGEAMSPEVAEAVEETVRRIVAELNNGA